MMKKLSVSALAVFAALAVLSPERAQAQVYFGPQLQVWDFEELGVGGRIGVGLGGLLGIEEGAASALFGTFNANYLFVGDSDFFGDLNFMTFNANLAVPFAMQGSVVPYAGGGVNRFRISGGGDSAGESGLNLLGGVFFDLGSIPSFLELQYSTTTNGYLSLNFGFLFGG